MCIICEKKYHTTNEYREQFNLKRNRDKFDENETIETTNANEKMTTTKDLIQKLMTKKSIKFTLSSILRF